MLRSWVGRRRPGVVSLVITGLSISSLALAVNPVTGPVGCAVPVVALLRADPSLPSPPVPPLGGPKEAALRDEVTSARAALDSATNDTVDLQAAEAAETEAVRAATRAESAVFEASLVGGSTGTADLDVRLAESRVDGAEAALSSAGDMMLSDSAMGFDSSFSVEMVDDAERDLATARTELAEAEEAAAQEQQEKTADEAEQSELQTAADQAEAEVARAGDVAATARRDYERTLEELQGALDLAEAALADHEQGQEDAAAAAYSDFADALTAARWRKARDEECRRRAQPVMTAAGLLLGSGAFLAVASRRSRRR